MLSRIIFIFQIKKRYHNTYIRVKTDVMFGMIWNANPMTNDFRQWGNSFPDICRKWWCNGWKFQKILDIKVCYNVSILAQRKQAHVWCSDILATRAQFKYSTAAYRSRNIDQQLRTCRRKRGTRLLTLFRVKFYAIPNLHQTIRSMALSKNSTVGK